MIKVKVNKTGRGRPIERIVDGIKEKIIMFLLNIN